MQNLSNGKRDQNEVDRKLIEARIHLAFCAELYKMQNIVSTLQSEIKIKEELIKNKQNKIKKYEIAKQQVIIYFLLCFS